MRQQLLRFRYTCDECGQTHEIDEVDGGEANARMNERGWQTGTILHYCPSHAVQLLGRAAN